MQDDESALADEVRGWGKICSCTVYLRILLIYKDILYMEGITRLLRVARAFRLAGH